MATKTKWQQRLEATAKSKVKKKGVLPPTPKNNLLLKLKSLQSNLESRIATILNVHNPVYSWDDDNDQYQEDKVITFGSDDIEIKLSDDNEIIELNITVTLPDGDEATIMNGWDDVIAEVSPVPFCCGVEEIGNIKSIEWELGELDFKNSTTKAYGRVEEDLNALNPELIALCLLKLQHNSLDSKMNPGKTALMVNLVDTENCHVFSEACDIAGFKKVGSFINSGSGNEITMKMWI